MKGQISIWHKSIPQKNHKQVFQARNRISLRVIPTYWSLRRRSTVAKAADWSRPQLVHEELAAVPHPDLFAPPAAVAAPVETNLPWNDSLVIARVISVQPARGVCTAVVDWHALGRHFNSCLASEAVPFVGHWTIALDHVGLGEGRLAVFIGYRGVRLAFWCGFN